MEINMNEQTFGNYLRSLRQKQDPPMTQEQLAKAIGRGKMTISQFENGKNAPPQASLLEKIICALNLTNEEKSKLIFLSSEERHTLPADIATYFFQNPSICEVIRAGQAKDVDDSFWRDLSKRIRNHNG